MRIGLNGWFLDQPHTGSGQYAIHLAAELARWGGIDVLTFRPGSQVGANGVAVPLRRPGGKWAKTWYEQVDLPRAARRQGVAVLHYPYFAGPLGGGPPCVITIHDLIPLLFPEYSSGALARAYNALVSAAARRAAAIIADSEHSRRDIRRVLGIAGERIHVTYLAPDEAFHTGVAGERVDEVRGRYGLGSYVFYIGGLNRHKNLPLLLQAFAQARARLAQPYQLAIAGQPHSQNRRVFPDLRLACQQAGLRWAERGEGQAAADVVFLGFVPEADKPALYRGARLFVYPSLYEGFGLPPLEAMACGTPVISSNAASLPEVVADGGLQVGPTDGRALSEAIAAVLNDGNLWQDLQARGLRQAARFSWQRTAAETSAVYRAVRALSAETVGKTGRTG